jgi:hypothetical protein
MTESQENMTPVVCSSWGFFYRAILLGPGP